MTTAIDEIDLAILKILNENARTSNAEIARQVGLAPTAIFQRIRKLETTGIITGYRVALDPGALGYGLTAFITAQTNERARDCDTAGMLAAIPEIREVHRVVSEDCFFMKVRVRDTDQLAFLLDHQIRQIPSISNTRTTIVLMTRKELDGSPLENLDAAS
jgi:Lrp/AsnC family leucine-responsive transcriptional regulator